MAIIDCAVTGQISSESASTISPPTRACLWHGSLWTGSSRGARPAPGSRPWTLGNNCWMPAFSDTVRGLFCLCVWVCVGMGDLKYVVAESLMGVFSPLRVNVCGYVTAQDRHP